MANTHLVPRLPRKLSTSGNDTACKTGPKSTLPGRHISWLIIYGDWPLRSQRMPCVRASAIVPANSSFALVVLRCCSDFATSGRLFPSRSLLARVLTHSVITLTGIAKGDREYGDPAKGLVRVRRISTSRFLAASPLGSTLTADLPTSLPVCSYCVAMISCGMAVRDQQQVCAWTKCYVDLGRAKALVRLESPSCAVLIIKYVVSQISCCLVSSLFIRPIVECLSCCP